MMMASCEEKRIEKESQQWVPLISKSSEISVLIYSLEAITKIGKNFPIIFLSLASLNVLLAANDFLSNRIEFGVMNSLFAVNGFVVLAQTYHNKTQPIPLDNSEIHSESLEIKE
jgi:hypothetical protein